MISKSYVGYHGTDNNAANSIIEMKKFKMSREEDDWLGQGVYFFEDIEDSHWWCKGKKRLSSYSIIEAVLNPQNVINLVSSSKDLENFKKLCDKVKNRSPKKVTEQ